MSITPNNLDQAAYNDYALARNLPKTIIDYLFENSPEFWKLLKYSINPLSYADLSADDKKNMICKSSFDTETFNVLFQKFTSDAVIEAKTQVRIYIDDITSYGRTNALARVKFQIIVNNKEMIINTPYSQVDKRDIAIAQTVVKTLNGITMPNTKSQMFINFDIDRFSGAREESFNDNYSGFVLVMDVWI